MHRKGKTLKKKSYFKKICKPVNKEKCFVCGKKGQLDNKCPNKNKNPRLVSLSSKDLDPTLWDLAWCEARDYPEGEIFFFIKIRRRGVI